MKTEQKKHFWWCYLWQWWHKREPNDYDGVCLHCGFDRYTSQHYLKNPHDLNKKDNH